MPSVSDNFVPKSGSRGRSGVGAAKVAPKHEPVARPGLHARLAAVHDLTPRQVLRSPLTLPVVIGDDFTVDEEYGWEDFTTVGSGEHSSPPAGVDARPLAKFTGESLTLTWNARWLAAPDQSPAKVRRELLAIGRRHAVFELLVVNKPDADFAEFSGYANIRRISRVLKRGEPDTRYYAIDFSEFRPMNVPRRSYGPRLPTTHSLDKEDTLRSLAGQYLGSPELWRMIAEVNGIKNWGSNDPLVESKRYKPGDQIKIPPRPPKPKLANRTVVAEAESNPVGAFISQEGG